MKSSVHPDIRGRHLPLGAGVFECSEPLRQRHRLPVTRHLLGQRPGLLAQKQLVGLVLELVDVVVIHESQQAAPVLLVLVVDLGVVLVSLLVQDLFGHVG